MKYNKYLPLIFLFVSLIIVSIFVNIITYNNNIVDNIDNVYLKENHELKIYNNTNNNIVQNIKNNNEKITIITKNKNLIYIIYKNKQAIIQNSLKDNINYIDFSVYPYGSYLLKIIDNNGNEENFELKKS